MRREDKVEVINLYSKSKVSRRGKERVWYLDAPYLPIYCAHVSDNKNMSSNICTKDEDNSYDE